MPPKRIKLLQRMKNSKADWKQAELLKAYKSWGFEIVQGKKHVIVKHPSYLFLRATVSRSDPLAVGYIETAIELIERLIELEAESGQE